MSNKNSKTKTKAVAILALIAAIATAAVMIFDGDPETNPDVIDVIDAGQDVIESFGDDDSDG